MVLAGGWVGEGPEVGAGTHSSKGTPTFTGLGVQATQVQPDGACSGGRCAAGTMSDLALAHRRSSHRTTRATTPSSSARPCPPHSTPSLEPAVQCWTSAAHPVTSTSRTLSTTPRPEAPHTVRGARGEPRAALGRGRGLPGVWQGGGRWWGWGRWESMRAGPQQ